VHDIPAEQAKKLLADAGVATPVPFTLTVTNSPDSLRFAQALQAMVKAGGFEMKIAPVEYTTLLDAEDTGNFQTLALGWSGRVDPDANMTQFFASGGAQNTNGVSDKALDALLQKARTTTDPAPASSSTAGPSPGCSRSTRRSSCIAGGT